MLSPLVPNYIKILSAYPGFLLADGYDEVNSSGAVDCYYEHFKKCSVTSSELDHMGQPWAHICLVCHVFIWNKRFNNIN